MTYPRRNPDGSITIWKGRSVGPSVGFLEDTFTCPGCAREFGWYDSGAFLEEDESNGLNELCDECWEKAK